MKWSIYNFIIKRNKDFFLLYNCKTEKVLSIVKELKELIEANINDVSYLKKIHPDLFLYLKNNEFIVSEAIKEKKEIMSKINEIEKETACFQLIINPTMGCNVRCWYCYETHNNNTIMPVSVINSVKLFIQNVIISGKYKELNINFFGGEPLLGYQDVMVPLLIETEQICNANKIPYYITMATNGILLTPEVVDYLVSFNKEIHLQIPFDGNRDFHNKVKRYVGEKDFSVYDIVIENIKYALTKGIHILIRCNYDLNTIGSFQDLIDEIKQIDENLKKRLCIVFKRIWQVKENKDTLKKVEEFGDFATFCGIADMNSTNALKYICYADRPSSVVINYNGDVFKCTARNFIKEGREGVLKEDGTIEFNNRYRERMEVKRLNLACFNCNVLPVCQGSCSQSHLELFQENTCPIGLSEEQKEEMIQKRLTSIIFQ